MGSWGCTPADGAGAASAPPLLTASFPVVQQEQMETFLPTLEPILTPSQMQAILFPAESATAAAPAENAPDPFGLSEETTSLTEIPDAVKENAEQNTISGPAFDVFVNAVMNGRADQIVGVYVENVLALRVIQQPVSDPAFVSPMPGVATEFLMAFQVSGNIGLLAHNYLAGRLFFDLQYGDIIQIVYGDGNVAEYEVQKIFEFQALNPDSPSSDFLNLENGEIIAASDLFNRMYGGEHHVTMQTCIDRDGEDTWGRLFVFAPRYE